MKLHFTDDWLKSWIAEEAEVDFEIGPEVEGASVFSEVAHAREEAMAVSAEKAASRQKTMLSAFLAALRRREKLSVKGLAERLGVGEAELRSTESDPSFSPPVPLLQRVANFVDQPLFVMQMLASSTQKKAIHGFDVPSLDAAAEDASARKMRRKSSEEFVLRFHKKHDT
jgi:transcriptional regulator with XRE-family HTH domain